MLEIISSPQKMAVVADKFTIRLQARLQEERAKQAAEDKNDALVLAERIAPMELSLVVKVDPDGHMYGSVAATDIVKLLADENVAIDRKNIVLPQPIRELGAHRIQLRLKRASLLNSFLILKVIDLSQEESSLHLKNKFKSMMLSNCDHNLRSKSEPHGSFFDLKLSSPAKINLFF
jgi:large subunit ribosomal protein L9